MQVGAVFIAKNAENGANMGSKMGGKPHKKGTKKEYMLDIVWQACSDANMEPQK